MDTNDTPAKRTYRKPIVPALEKKRAYAREYARRRSANAPKHTEETRARRREYEAGYRNEPGVRARLNTNARRRRAANPEPTRLALRKYRAKNLEQMRTWTRECMRRERIAHPKRVRARESANTSQRRALAAGSGGRHTVADWIVLCYASGWRCFYCPKPSPPLDERTAVKEHRIPLIRGGSNDISNIVLSCAACNGRKGTKTDVEFMALAAA